MGEILVNSSSLSTEGIMLAKWAQTIQPSPMQEMLSNATGPDMISFALGLPATELFPHKDYAEAAQEVLANPATLQYAPPFQPIKTEIVSLMAAQGVTCREEEIFVTAGAQQGMSLLSRLLLNERSQVVMEELSYPGFQQVLDPFQVERLTVPIDLATGMDVDAVEYYLKQGVRPAFIYAITNGHNPCGVSMSLEKRKHLVRLAQQYRVPIIEDDPYGMLWYDDEHLPPLRALDDEWVLYVGSFSKIAAPSLRTGWLVVPPSMTDKLSIIKEATDINMATFTQRLIYSYLTKGLLADHLARLRREYGYRRDTMLNSLIKHFPASAKWQKPTSGFFVWVEMEHGFDTIKLLQLALEQARIAFIPGPAFSAKSELSSSGLRLNFTHRSPSQIEQGISRLAGILSTMVQ